MGVQNNITLSVGTSSDDPLVTALYAFDAQVGFRNAHSAVVTALYDKQVALYLGILETGQAQGHFTLGGPALDIAQNLVALEDAYGLHIITGNRTLPPQRAAELIHGFAVLATDCPEIPSARPPAEPTTTPTRRSTR